MTYFETVYSSFLQKIEDYKILDMSDKEVMEMLKKLMISAISKCKTLEHNLSDRNDEMEMFNNDLLDIEIEVISLQMVQEWLRPQVNSTLITKQFFGGNDSKFYAQANHLSELLALQNQTKIETKKLIRDYTYQNYNFGS